MDLTGEVGCPYCNKTIEFQVKYERNQTVEYCDGCEKYFAAEAEVNVETKSHKIDTMNEEE